MELFTPKQLFLTFVRSSTLHYSHPSGPAFRDARGEQTARRGHPNTLKRAQKSRTNGCMKQAISDAEDHNSAATCKEPFFICSSIFSKITQRLGNSRSRDTSPEKMVSFGTAENSFFIEKANRTQDHQEWNNESKNNQAIRRAPPPYKPSSSNILQSTGPDYYVNEMPGTYKTEILCNAEELPASGYIRVANSKFYYSFAERWAGNLVSLT
ncbi:unnamed protein product [Onchocerca flexuosa]|uniref:SKICH domain-containing protein n=1 Tax=Onchocerca flexuosa TaxID=387005 RepID=A0A183I6W6_9BILA|nr:unnamed protein product [Onchocerca flexuosa]